MPNTFEIPYRLISHMSFNVINVLKMSYLKLTENIFKKQYFQ